MMVWVVPIVATAFTAPVSWPAFGKIPAAFLPSNVLTTPVVTVLVVCLVLWLSLPTMILPECLGEALLFVAKGLIGFVEAMGDQHPPVLLPLNVHVTAALGIVAFIAAYRALKTRRFGVNFLAGTMTVWALIGVQRIRDRHPRSYAIRDQMVCFDGFHWSVFSAYPNGHIKWETRSFLERVSQASPDTVVWCGDRLAFSRTQLRYIGRDGKWHQVNSPP